MVEVDNKGTSPKTTLNRRKFLTGITATVAATALSASGCSPSQEAPPNQGETTRRQETVKKLDPEIVKTVEEWIEQGRNMKTPEDSQMLDETRPGIDLTYWGNATVAVIRNLSLPHMFAAAIGFLDVEKSLRYNREWNPNPEDNYACNIYALDFLRLILGNDVIGSLYDKKTGEPYSIGINQLEQERGKCDPETGSHRFLSSNDIDLWLRTYGINYGWQEVTSQESLRQSLVGSIGLAVTPDNVVKEETKKALERGERYSGHSLVVFGLGENGSGEPGFGITQATYNILFHGYPPNDDHPKVNPQSSAPENKRFAFWTHKIIS
ncbi:MAG: twin-arginine translocation signal domain-containing protein [Candidatus Shapirobacteria bacterium]|nr:twin-arginine translocation signal domain-containing protein [Candidatus Shapirobacteria bacterium]